MTDLELLGEYGRTKAQGAFEELVRRHVDWVYSAAVRQVRDRQLAEDVTQAVFIALAQKAGRLHGDRPLSSWLMTVTRCAAINAVRAESRRRRREQEAAAMRRETAQVEQKAEWEEIALVLDEQVLRLKQKDRDAVMLRFYERRSFAEVGQALGISEEAARKRVDRAVEQLRARMAGKGVTIGAGALAVVVAERLVEQSPRELVQHVIAGGGAATGAGAIAKGALGMMAWTKVKVAGIIAVVSVLAGSALVAAGLVPGGSTLSVQVLLPDGTPAAGAQVYLARAGEDVMFVNNPTLVPGQRGPSSRPTAAMVTGADGRFALTAEQQKRPMLAIVHMQGVADAVPEDLGATPLTLKPWGKVQGQLSAALRGGTGQRVTASHRRMTADGFQLYYEFESPVDREGRFAFPNMPPGRCSVTRVYGLTRAMTEMSFGDHLTAVMVEPGQVAMVSVGGVGVNVRGHVEPPEGSGWKLADTYAYVELMEMVDRPAKRPPGFPEDFGKMSREQQQAWLRTWAKSEEGRAYIAEYEKHPPRTGGRVVSGIRGDGVFDLAEVPAGEYRMMITVSALNQGPAWGLGKALGWLEQDVVIPEGGAGQVVDLGRFVLKVPEERGR